MRLLVRVLAGVAFTFGTACSADAEWSFRGLGILPSGQESWGIGVSADGRVIVGTGVNPVGHSEAWIATVPEPSTLVLSATGVLALLVLARRRRHPAHA